jgi:hypothetical protein
MSQQQHIPLLTILQSNMWFLPPLTCTWFLPFEQLTKQQIVQFKDFNLKHLHYCTLSNMLFNMTAKAHCVQILLCFGFGVSVWFMAQLIFPTFQLFLSLFFTTFQTWFGLPHPSITSLPQCMCIHPINPMGIHLLHYAHGNVRTWTYYVIHNIFVTIAQGVSIHMGQE